MNSVESSYERRGEVALIKLSNPPVNGLSYRLRLKLAAGLDGAMADHRVKAIVIIGADQYFSCGADIREFNTPNATKEPITPALIKRIEGVSKPVVAAIHGAALGGGLELALGCHYRVADAGAQMGLPEVKLGLIPGGGGTQRLPRVVGVQNALEMILSGKSIDARKARDLGLIDAVFDDELEGRAIEFAVSVIGQPLEPRLLAQRTPTHPDADAFFSAAREKARKESRGLTAPIECIACVEKSLHHSLEEGLQFERERFLVLVSSVESKAMRHLFFAEREAGKPTRLNGKTTERHIERIGIIGAGTMGTGIAMTFANAGFPVALIEVNQDALAKGLRTIEGNYAATVSKGRLQPVQMQERLARIRGTTEFDPVADADLVIEAVFEDMAVKRSVFERIDQIAKPGAIVASNTSRLDINEIALMTSRPSDVLGLHFFSPANVMRLLEVVRGRQTSDDVILTAMNLAKRVGKVPVLVGVCDGFVGNRMVSPYTREAHFLLEEGATPQQVDKALQRFGMAMGPLRMGDMAGLDISWAARKRQAATRPANVRYCRIADRICEAGRFGQKTGAGFYRYEPGSRTPVPDPRVEQLIEACARESGIVRRTISDEEIVERTIFALVNEGAKILQEGIAQRASDIDVIYVNGYGFPAVRGGPMFYADSVGLDRVLERIRAFHAQHGELWTPAPLLEQLVRERQTLATYQVAVDAH